MSNITFMKTDWQKLFETVREKEQNLTSTTSTSLSTSLLRQQTYK